MTTPPTHNVHSPNVSNDAGEAEATLRLIAGLPAPKGLEDRLKAGLLSAPRMGRVLDWPSAAWTGGGWMHGKAMRAAAAAAIVFVVAGGGWGVYSRVQSSSPKVMAMPARMVAPGGFSTGGAMRTPQTLQGPVVPQAANPEMTETKVGGSSTKKQQRGKAAMIRKAPAAAAQTLN